MIAELDSDVFVAWKHDRPNQVNSYTTFNYLGCKSLKGNNFGWFVFVAPDLFYYVSYHVLFK